MTRRRRGNGGRRGYAHVAAAVAIVAGGVFFDPLFGDALQELAELRDAADRQSQQQARRAAAALTDYMLARALRQGDVKIKRGSAAEMEPRFLMLPCPDNWGDGKLDGTQDPTCGVRGNAAPLDGGARFGRLPWDFAGLEPSGIGRKPLVGDGLGVADLRDGYGNGLWYAVSRNFAPIESGAHPLNLHSLAARTDGWLSVVDEYDQPKRSPRVAAVVIAPGAPAWGQSRPEENEIRQTEFDWTSAKRKTEGEKFAKKFMEEVQLEVDGRTVIVRNYDGDGKFVAAPGAPTVARQTNDHVAFITMEDLIAPDSRFMKSYRQMAGVAFRRDRPAHNHPVPGSPLETLRDAIKAHYDFFGFYPSPAALKTEHVTTRDRHCAEWKIPRPTDALVSQDVMALTTPAPILVSVSLSSVENLATVVLHNDSPFLAARPVEVALPVSYVRNDDTHLRGDAVLARLARMTVRMSSTIVAPVSLRAAATLTISAGIQVAVPSFLHTVDLPKNTPLHPGGMMFGLLPEHSRTTMTVINAGPYLTVHGRTRIQFMGETQPWTGEHGRIILPDDRIYLPAGGRFNVRENLDAPYRLDNLIVERAGANMTLPRFVPPRAMREKMHLAVQLTTDAERVSRIRGVSVTIVVKAPAVVYPWRAKVGTVELTRDHYHPYPPCLDSRDIHTDVHRHFVEDQPTHYAVAKECHYGGSQARCESAASISVVVSPSVQFALPSEYAATMNATITAGVHPSTVAIVTLIGGVVDGIMGRDGESIPTVVLSREQWVDADDDGAERALLEDGVTLAVSVAVYFPSGNIFVSSNTVVVENVQALLMYSPGPLRHVECSTTPQDEGDLTEACSWLDRTENIDGDERFEIPHPDELKKPNRFNDYFIFFGGRVTVVAPP